MQKIYSRAVALLVMAFLFLGNIALGQVTLSGTSYIENFDGIASGYPTGWTGRTGSTASSIGTAAALTTVATAWNNTAGAFKNCASNDGADLSTNTDRSLSVRQASSFGDPGASFLLQIANTTGLSNFQLSFKLQSLDAASPRTTAWQVQYAIGAAPTSFTTITTTPAITNTGGTTSSNTTITATLPSVIDNSTGNVWIRIVTLSASTGSGNRATTGIDDFNLTYSSAANTLSINDVSLSEGNSGTTNATFTVSLSQPAPAGGVTFDIATANGTATEPSDYTANAVIGASIPEGSSSYTFTVLVNGDTDVEPNETFLVNISNVVGAQAGDVQGQATITNEDIGIVKIHAIQGAGATSPLVNTTQTVQGIVTRTFYNANSLNTFYMQEEDADADSDPFTSEAIAVFNTTAKPNVGDLVTVSGNIIEFTSTGDGNTSSLTEFGVGATVTLVSSGNPLPTATPVSLPVANVSDLERYENMLVNLTASSGNLVVTDNFNLGRYGQIVLAANDPATNAPGTDARIDQYTQFQAPSVSGNTAYLEAIKKRIIYVDDANTQQNIDPIIFGRGGQPLSGINTLRTGDEVPNVLGILDHRFEGYRIQLATSAELNVLPTNARPATPDLNGSPALVVGNMNVLNYFNGPFPGPRGANTATEFTRQRDKILQMIINSGADVLSLNEIENDGFGSSSAIQDLVNGLNGATAPGTWAFITPPSGTVVSNDEITCGMIYKPAKATPVGNLKAYLEGEFALVNRAAIAQTFKQNSNNAKFTVVGNHFKSKGGTASGLNVDQNDGQGQFNDRRTKQAQQLAAWLATDPTGSGDPDFIIVGDLNAYAKEDPLTTLESAGYINLIPSTNTSYQFDGAHGALDHALGTASIQAQVVSAKKWNINADEPTALDYNIQLDNGTIIKTPTQVTTLYASDQYRSSDHDPVLVGLNLACDNATTNTTTVSACDSYTWAVTGQTYTSSGVYTGTTTNCVTEKLDLTITPSTTNTTTATACDSYTWAVTGQTYTSSGVYTGTTTNCVTEKLDLTITPSTETITSETACGSYYWAVTGQTYNSSGTYTNVSGCHTDKLILSITDAITYSGISYVGFDCFEIEGYYAKTVKFQLEGLNPNTSFIIYGYISDSNFPFVLGAANSDNDGKAIISHNFSAQENPIPYKVTITKIFKYTGSCDFIPTSNNSVNFSVDPLPVTETNASICSGQTYTWPVNGQSYNTLGTYTILDDCHLYTLILTETPSSTNTTTAAACDSYTWAVTGQTYTSSGVYTGTTTNCVTEKLDLTITPGTTNTTTAAACDSYSWAVTGLSYTSSGTYTNTTGCHTEKLELTITPSTETVTTISACDSYTWAVTGLIYTSSGTYTKTTGCHTEKLVLTITPSSTSTMSITACDTYTWAANGQTYTQSGTYNFVAGCTTQVLVLTIKTAGTISGQSILCKGSTVQFTSSLAGGVWAVSNGSVATVGNNGNNRGKVTALNFGTTLITYTLNGCTSTFSVTVGDILAPVITCPANIVKSLSGNNNCSTKINVPALVVTDNCGGVTIGFSMTGATVATGSGAVGNRTFNVGVTNIVYTATDAVGNSSTCASTVTVTNSSCTSSGRLSAEALPAEIEKLSVSVSNNPTNQEFTLNIASGKASNVSLSIIGLDGKTYQQVSVKPNTEVRVGAHLKAGLYILQAQQQKETVRLKIIKQ